MVGSGLPMRQVVISRFGAPDVLEIREAPDPSPGEGDIRIRVRAAGINFADILARLWLYPDAPRPPMVVGYEVSGRVDALGRAVVGVSEGDRVIALTRFGRVGVTVRFSRSRAIALRRRGGRTRLALC
jgi:NADPH:quinone reductase-like Zn-dependent oxidoreductase